MSMSLLAKTEPPAGAGRSGQPSLQSFSAGAECLVQVLRHTCRHEQMSASLQARTRFPCSVYVNADCLCARMQPDNQPACAASPKTSVQVQGDGGTAERLTEGFRVDLLTSSTPPEPLWWCRPC